MNKNKPIALAFADAHIHQWENAYSYKGDRLFNSLKPLEIIGLRAKELKVPVLFPGDLFHNWKSLNNQILMEFIGYFKEFFENLGVDFIGISGDHDMSRQNTYYHKSPSYIKSFSNIFNHFHCIDGVKKEIIPTMGKRILVYGIPYLTHNLSFEVYMEKFIADIRDNKDAFKILLIHTDLPGARNGYGFEIGEVKKIPKDINTYFNDFNLVLSGHIHKPQQLGNNIYMLGATHQQNAGDRGIDMGYWEIYEKDKPKFVNLNLPEFKYYNSKKEIPDNFHIYIPKPKKEKEMGIVDKGFDNTKSKTKIAKNYLKKKGIKDKDKRIALIKTLKTS
jgi:DNA repair exonuclease SbcCD nuclease subunit